MDITPMRILLVEDNPADARLLKELLRDEPANDLEFADAESLAGALKLLEDGSFEVILLDLSLPDSAGFSTFSAVHESAPDVPIVVLTGLHDETLAVKAVEAGAQDYLIKGQVDGATLSRSIRYSIVRQNAQTRIPVHLAEHGRLIGFMGAKGGVGTTTAVLNLAAALASQGKSVIAAEMRSHYGTFSAQLGGAKTQNLSRLSDVPADKIGVREIGALLTNHSSGLRIVYGPQAVDEYHDLEPEQVEATMGIIAGMASHVLVEMCNHPSTCNQAVAKRCDYIVLVTAGDPICIAAGLAASGLLASWGVATDRVGALVVNRPGQVSGMAVSEISRQLGLDVIGVVPTIPEDALLAAQKRGEPFVLLQPDSVVARMVAEVAERLSAGRIVALAA